jgi:AraC-like DNA-binding protein
MTAATVERWDMRSIAGRDPASAWREILSRAYIPFDARPAPQPGERFGACASRQWLGDLALVETAHGRGTGRRGRDETAGPSGDLLGVTVLLHGRQVLRMNGDSVVIKAGEAAIWDGSRPGGFEAGEPVVKRTLLVPRARFRAVFPRVEGVVGRVLAADSPPVRLLAGFLDTVASLHPALDDAARSAAADAVMDLARAAAGAGLPAGADGLHSILLTQARRYIEEHLGEPALDPVTIAQAHAVSVRTLQRVFEETGESVTACIRRVRLERCYRDLAAGQGPVTTVAFEWGFRECAHFSRAFRKAFGTSARDVLAAARSAAA